MGTLRRRNRTQRQRVTDEAVAAYTSCDHAVLQRALRLPPWQVSPLEADGPCPYSEGSGGGGTWADSVPLRKALDGHR